MMIPKIKIIDFIAATNSLFDGFVNTLGYKIEELYYLEPNRALTDYINNCKKGKDARFMPNNSQNYLNRCRYCIYQEKRGISKDKNGKEIKVDSAEVFSQKTVRLFFQLSGVYFYFLILQPIDNNASPMDVAFRRIQEMCLDDLFTVTVGYLSYFQDTPDTEYNITHFNLINLWKLLYRKYRYQLFSNTYARISSPQDILLNDEAFQYMTILMSAYQDLLKLNAIYDASTEDEFDSSLNYIDERNEKQDLLKLSAIDDASTEDKFDSSLNYIDERNEKIKHLKEGYEIEKDRMNKLVRNIQYILTLDAKEDSAKKKVYQKLLPQKEWTEFDKCVNDSSKSVFWKHYLIEKVIERFYQKRKHSLFHSVLYLQNFEEAIKEYLEIGNKMWEMIFSVSDNMEAVNCLISGTYLNKLICELDETLWFLYYQNGDLSSE